MFRRSSVRDVLECAIKVHLPGNPLLSGQKNSSRQYKRVVDAPQ